jgi:hypothetical protein
MYTLIKYKTNGILCDKDAQDFFASVPKGPGQCSAGLSLRWTVAASLCVIGMVLKLAASV